MKPAIAHARKSVCATAMLVAAGLAFNGAGANASIARDPVSSIASSSTPSNSVAAAVAGETLVFQDEFNGTSLNRNAWAVYNGGKRRASNTSVGGGVLRLRNQKVGGVWTAAGVSNARAVKQSYGRYVVRARLDQGWGVRAVALLWPVGNIWPPEIDFLEYNANDPARTQNNLTLHYRPGHQMTHAHHKCTCSQWHTFEVLWQPGRLTYKMDGRVTATMSNHVPSGPMWLALQSQVGGMSAKPDGRTPSIVDYEIDWVKIYKRT